MSAARVRFGGLAFLLVVSLMLQMLVQVPAARADSSPVTGLSKDSHPVVLVHGWTGSPMQDTRTMLEKSLGRGWQFLLFDYTADNTRWAGDQRIWAPLADYVKKVSAAHKRVGGDGLVYFVAHSMGGLAIRFASRQPDVAAAIGGVVTVGTPHQGSLWGNASGSVWGKLAEIAKGKVFDPPEADSMARVCLAVHSKGKGLPKECSAPPYLPAGIPLQQIAGSVVLERKYFGLHAYDITVGGDSIVSASSADGYIGSAAGDSPKGSFAPIRLDCRIPESSLLSLAAPGVAVPWQLFTDEAMMDQLMNDKASVAVALVVGRILMVKDSCAHGAMMTNSEVVAQIEKSLMILAAKHEPLTMAGLKNVPVPSLCDHPAGKLKGGVLKGNGHNGDVVLDQSLSRLGHVIPGQPGGAAAVFHCSQGGIGWPDYVLFYSNQGKLVGTFDSGEVGSMPGRQQIGQVVIRDNEVQVTIEAVPLEEDNELWGSSMATAIFQWSSIKAEMKLKNLAVSTPDALAVKFSEALQRRSLSAAKALAPDATIDPQMLPSPGVKVRFDRCIGPDNQTYGSSIPGIYGVNRGCLINYNFEGRPSVSMAVVTRTGAAWKIVAFFGVGA